MIPYRLVRIEAGIVWRDMLAAVYTGLLLPFGSRTKSHGIGWWAFYYRTHRVRPPSCWFLSDEDNLSYTLSQGQRRVHSPKYPYRYNQRGNRPQKLSCNGTRISPKTTLALRDDKTKKGTTPTPKELLHMTLGNWCIDCYFTTIHGKANGRPRSDLAGY